MKKFDSINVIPFVDILLVLLTIVLMSSTFITRSLMPINVPKSTSSQQNTLTHVAISITKEGAFFYEKEPFTQEKLIEHLKTLTRSTPVTIQCDKEAPFEFFVTLLDTLANQHFSNVSILTQP